MKAVLIVSHGSRSPKTKIEVNALVDVLKQRTAITIFEMGFLELETPSIPKGIDCCVQKGATDITILLNFLNSGRHVDYDIPEIIQMSQNKYPHVKFHITRPVGQHQGIANLFISMLNDNL